MSERERQPPIVISEFPLDGSLGRGPTTHQYQDVPFPPLCVKEREDMVFRKCTKEQITAFTIANKGDNVSMSGNGDGAEHMGYEAISHDCGCIDGWRLLTSLIARDSDCDTVVCACREILSLARYLSKDILEEHPTEVYSVFAGRPYLRVLHLLARQTILAEMTDCAIYAFEELLRLDRNDPFDAREALLSLYLKNFT